MNSISSGSLGFVGAALRRRLLLLAAVVLGLCAGAVVGDVVAPPQARAASLVPIIETVAGNGKGTGCSGDGGPATDAAMNTPQAVAVAANGNTYIADAGNNVIRMIATSSGTFFGQRMTAGDIYTVAGDSVEGYSGDGGPATSAQLGLSETLAVRADGSLYIADFTCNCIRQVTANGTIQTFASGFDTPLGVGFDAPGNLYVAAVGANRIFKVAADGSSSPSAGTGVPGYAGDGGPATFAHLDTPHGLAVGVDGSVYFSDRTNSRIRVISPQGIISTYAGNGTAGFSGDGGPATDAEVDYVEAVAIGPHGDLYIADSLNNRIREVITPVPRVPATPTGLTATPATGSVTLSWQPNPATDAVSHYNIYRTDQSAGGPWATPTGTSFTNASSVVNGTLYCYKLSASNSSGESTKTAPVCATPTPPPVPPAAIITRHPPGASTQTTATFMFTDGQAGVRFKCSLDGGPFSDCSSPRRYYGLGSGQHTFQVHTVDSLGQASSDTSYTWTVNGAVKGARRNNVMTLGNIREWVWSAVIDQFYGPRHATKVTAFRVAHCAKQRSGRFRCGASWKRKPYAFAGTVTIGSLNPSTGRFRSGFSLVRRNTLTGAKRVNLAY